MEAVAWLKEAQFAGNDSVSVSLREVFPSQLRLRDTPLEGDKISLLLGFKSRYFRSE